MAWIELHQAVWTHRKTVELASRLALSETHAAAHVIRLWTWALDNAPSGDLSRTSGRAIAFGSGWGGDADVFVSAMVESGWLDADRKIHDWADYAGRLIARREADARRKRESRTGDPDIRGTSPGQSGTVPNRTLPNTTTSSLATLGARARGRGAGAPTRRAKGTTPTKGSSARGTDAPERLEITAADVACGVSLGFGVARVEHEADRMLDHFRGKGIQRVDWHATLRNWLRKAAQIDEDRAAERTRANGQAADDDLVGPVQVTRV